MARKKKLTLKDIAGILGKKPLATETYIIKDEGLKFEIKALSEIEYIYLGNELQKLESVAEQSLLGIHLAIALGVKKIFKEVEGEWLEIELEQVEADALGEEIKLIDLGYIAEWDLKTVKAPLSQKINEVSSMSKGEALKLELFR